MTEGINSGLAEYIRKNIIPMYDCFDGSHDRDHVLTVIDRCMSLADRFGTDRNMLYTAAAYHDTGLSICRETHHLESGRIIRSDVTLAKWFSPEQIEVIAQAAEDHRASAAREPRSIYGLILAEADRTIEPETIVCRTVRYGLSHYAELDKEGQWNRALKHLVEKYGEEGYLKLWLKDSPNAEGLESLRAIIRDRSRLRALFERFYDKYVNSPK
ncbi:MAG: HD domain-containing protein [Bacteroidaceae bacterium]|nr:HD domain-containing protein [Bacteroidaceae bacterium]